VASQAFQLRVKDAAQEQLAQQQLFQQKTEAR